MKQVKITKLASEICWWKHALGQTCTVLDIYEPTGYIKIRTKYVEMGFEDQPINYDGWIGLEYTEPVE